MMRKLISMGLSFMMCLSAINMVKANNETNRQDDEIYVEYTIEELPSSRSSYRKSGKKTASVKSGSTVLWTVTVTGTFEYTGSTSICTASSVTTTCPATNWKITSKSASKSGATASAKATASRYNNGSVVETKTQSVFLVCGSDGTLY